MAKKRVGPKTKSAVVVRQKDKTKTRKAKAVQTDSQRDGLPRLRTGSDGRTHDATGKARLRRAWRKYKGRVRDARI